MSLEEAVVTVASKGWTYFPGVREKLLGKGCQGWKTVERKARQEEQMQKQESE